MAKSDDYHICASWRYLWLVTSGIPKELKASSGASAATVSWTAWPPQGVAEELYSRKEYPSIAD